MSTSFLTAAERERWQRFPETIPQDDLAVYFLLSDDDTREVNRQREPFNRLGYALQLCALRYLGFVPTDFTATPEGVVTFVAEQLAIAPRVLALYDNRETQSDHRRHVETSTGPRARSSAAARGPARGREASLRTRRRRARRSSSGPTGSR